MLYQLWNKPVILYILTSMKLTPWTGYEKLLLALQTPIKKITVGDLSSQQLGAVGKPNNEYPSRIYSNIYDHKTKLL